MAYIDVTLIDHMGSDLSVCNAARVSFAKESVPHPSGSLYEHDEKLISYLANHNHKSPFNHCFASFRVKAPVFVARQLVKHEYMPWNEISRRYVDSIPEFYTPEAWRKRADNVKQGSSSEIVQKIKWGCDNASPDDAFEDALALCEEAYESLLAAGVCPELARTVLPQAMMTEWIWSGSLFAIAKMCKLRLDPHTQYETQLVAIAIDEYMRDLFPVSWKALLDGNGTGIN